MTKGEITMGRAAVAATPYMLVHLLVILILTLFPVIVTFLPDLLA